MSEENLRPIDLVIHPTDPKKVDQVEADFSDIAYFRQQGGQLLAFASELDAYALVNEESVTINDLQARASDFVAVTLYADMHVASAEDLKLLVNPAYVRDVLPNTQYASRFVAALDNRPFLNPRIQEIHLATTTPRHLAVEGTLEEIQGKFIKVTPVVAPIQSTGADVGQPPSEP